MGTLLPAAAGLRVKNPAADRTHKRTYLGGDAALPANEWQRFEQTFTTGSPLDKAAVYLYNTHTDVTSWYDDLELRPVE